MRTQQRPKFLLLMGWLIAQFLISLPAIAALRPETISAGKIHSCGIQVDGALVCWGNNGNHQADPPTGQFVQLSAGDAHNCAIRTDGSVACWGYNNARQASPPPGTFAQVSAGVSHTCGVQTDGWVACWGTNKAGQSRPPAIQFNQVSAGAAHTCGVATDGALYCWGANGKNQATPPTGVFVQVSAGAYHNCAIKADGSLACWGDNSNGQSKPPAGTFSQVGVGSAHSCAVRTDNAVICWGSSAGGRTLMPVVAPYQQVSSDVFHSCGLQPDGHAVCWGVNKFWQIKPPAGVLFSVGGSQKTTSTTLTAEPAQLAVGDTLTLTAQVSGQNSNLTGSVNFLDGSTLLGSANLTDTQAVFSTDQLSTGEHSLTARYNGDSQNSASTSKAVIVSVEKRSQAPLVLQATPTSIVVGGSSRLSTTGGSGDGAVSYAATATGDKLKCSLNGNVLTATGGVGRCSVTATKAGDAAYAAVTSAPVTVTVERDSLTNWSQLKPLLVLSPQGASERSYGQTLAAEADTLWVGAPQASVENLAQRGLVYLRKNTAQDTWPAQTNPATVGQGNAGDLFGSRVVINGNWAAVSALGADRGALQNVGQVLIYQKQSNGWQFAQTLRAEDSALFSNAGFGAGLALTPDWLAIGAPNANQGDGAVYLYTLQNGRWEFHSELVGRSGQIGHFGAALALDNNRLVVGAPDVDHDNTGPSGALYAYRYADQAWIALSNTQLPLPDLALFRNGQLGAALTLQGDSLVVAAPNTTILDIDRQSHPQAGRVFLYVWDNQAGFILSPSALELSNAQLSDQAQFGFTVALAERGKSLLIGAPGADSNNLKDNGRAVLYQVKAGSWVAVQNFPGNAAAQGLGRSTALLSKAAFLGTDKGQVWTYRPK